MDLSSNAFGDLGLGATGTNVSELQAKLAKLGFPVDVTGAFDEATQNALRNFQSRVGLPASGALNGPTENLLNQALLRQGGAIQQSGGDLAPPGPCQRPLWQTGLMVAGGIALAYGAWVLFNKADDDEEGEGYARALEPGTEEKDITSRSRRIAGADKCGRTPASTEFLKAPRVEA